MTNSLDIKKIETLSQTVAIGVNLIMSADEMYFTMMDYIRVMRARQEAIKYIKYKKLIPNSPDEHEKSNMFIDWLYSFFH